jgi:hypothetical protein
MRWPTPPARLAARAGTSQEYPRSAEEVQPVRYGGSLAS